MVNSAKNILPARYIYILLFVIANKIGHVKVKNLTRGLYVYRDTPISRLIFVGFYLF